MPQSLHMSWQCCMQGKQQIVGQNPSNTRTLLQTAERRPQRRVQRQGRCCPVRGRTFAKRRRCCVRRQLCAGSSILRSPDKGEPTRLRCSRISMCGVPLPSASLSCAALRTCTTVTLAAAAAAQNRAAATQAAWYGIARSCRAHIAASTSLPRPLTTPDGHTSLVSDAPLTRSRCAA